MTVEDPFALVVAPPEEEVAPESESPAGAELGQLLAGTPLTTEVHDPNGSLKVETQISLTRRSWRYRTAVLRGTIEIADWPVKVEDRTRKILDEDLTDELRVAFATEALTFHRRRCREVDETVREQAEQEPQRRRTNSPIVIAAMVLLFLLASVGGWLFSRALASRGRSEVNVEPSEQVTSLSRNGGLSGVAIGRDEAARPTLEATVPHEEPSPAAVAVPSGSFPSAVTAPLVDPGSEHMEEHTSRTGPSSPAQVCSGDPDALLNAGNEALLARDVPAALQLFERAAGCGGSYAFRVATLFDPAAAWPNRSITPDPEAALHFYAIAIRYGQGQKIYPRLRQLRAWVDLSCPDDSTLRAEIEELRQTVDSQ